MNKEELHKFNNRFNSFALAFEQLKKDQHRNSIDKSITINEVHLIDLIGRNQPVNLVKLSELLEVSRSAITQSVRRLTKKDLVSFEFAPDNEKNKGSYIPVYTNHNMECFRKYIKRRLPSRNRLFIFIEIMVFLKIYLC